MYYTDSANTISSFNFATTVSSATVTVGAVIGPGSRQIINTNYGICIQMNAGFCSITWTANTFSVSGDATQAATSLSGAACTTDYVVIPGSTLGDRFCGTAFPTMVTSKYLLIN